MTILQSAPTNRRSDPNEWWEATKTAICGLLIATGVHTFVAEVRYIPSESMVPTLQVGDRLIVEKLSYRLHPPKRGDIVVFKAPLELKARNLNDDMIKRVIGVPGDVVAISRGTVFINGQEVTQPYVQNSADYSYGPVKVPADSYFVLGDNRNHSYDSHIWGFVPQQNIVGHTLFRFYPLRKSRVE
jgi:signal peptidase I